MVEITEEARITEHLTRSVRGYWPGLDGHPRPRLRVAQRRPGARLYWYDVDGLEAPRAVVVKVPGTAPDLARADAGPSDRPRLLTPMDASGKYEREFQALQALERHFEGIGDSRFRTIRPLERLDAVRGFVTEVISGSNLKRHFAAASRARIGGPNPSLWRIIESAGAWLRAYHDMPMPDAAIRQSDRDEFAANVHRFADHLSSVVGRPQFFRSVARAAESSASALPDPLPLAVTHGDYAMRNILVTPDERVAVLDTLAVWRAPIYEDVAKFGLSLRSTRPQIMSHRLAFSATRLDQAVRSFHAGYFGDIDVPVTQIRLYELLLLLDKWSFERAMEPRGRSPVATYQRRSTDRWFTTEARALIRDLA